MSTARDLSRQGGAVALSCFLVLASSRATAGAPSGEEVARKWRERRPVRLHELRRGGFEEVVRRLRAERGEVPPWRRGRRSVPAGLVERFHANPGAPEPTPLNPLLDPLGILGDETGEEPPIGPVPRVFFADFDGDGDLDVFVGDKYGYVRYLRNDAGPGEEPVFTELTGAASPTGSLDLSEDDADADTTPFGPAAPTLVDLDGDGDLDLFVGQGYYGGRVLFFENVGGVLVRNDAGNPLAAFTFGEGAATPHFVDLDGDGDFDLFVGTKYESPGPDGGEVFFLRNEGDETTPVFVDQTEVPGQDPFAGVPFFPLTAPFFADVDGDGDLDAFVGSFGKVRFFRNETVVPGPPVFVEETGYENPIGGGLGLAPGPVLVDLDGDGDLDAFLGLGFAKTEELGFVQYFLNTGTPTEPAFLAPGDRLELVDVDGDGDLDALVSNLDASIADTGDLAPAAKTAAGPASPMAVWYFENTGTAAEPVWQLRSGLDNPFCTFNSTYAYSDTSGFPSLAPTVGDLDGDGLLDSFVGLPDGTLEFLEDDGTGQLDPAATHPLEAVDFGDAADPELVDVNGDGELDLVVGHDVYDVSTSTYGSFVSIFLNPPGPAGLDVPADFVLDFSDDLVRPAPTMADADGDGDPDLFVGGYDYDTGYASLLFVENTGSPTAPVFDPIATPAEVQIDTPVSPALADVNGDGLPDLFLGNLAGVEMFLTAAPELEVTKEITGGDLAPGGTVEYTIVLTNVGTGAQPDDADDPELTDTLPSGLALVSAVLDSGPGAVSTSGDTVRYDGALDPGESAVIVVTANIIVGVNAVIENQAVAFYDADADGENDTEEPSDDPTTGAVDDPTAFETGGIDIAEIPTLSQWGSVLFAGLLSLLGLFGLRRFGGG